MIIFQDSIANLNNVKNLYSTWPSIYPLLYKELNLLNKKNFEFYNKKIADTFKSLRYSKSRNESIDIYIKNTLEIFTLNNERKQYTTRNFIEFLYTFYAWEKGIKEDVFNARKPFLLERYENNSKDENIFWRHDGWWNCYYGKTKDLEALKILSKKVKKSSNIQDKIKTSLTLAYRYAETGDIKAGRKVIKKALSFIKIKIFLIHLFGKIEYTKKPEAIMNSKINYFIFTLNSYYSDYCRYKLNLVMFLYRTEKNNRKKSHLINKLIKQNKFSKLFIRDTVSKFYNQLHFTPKMYMRPQHILRLIEIRIDKYCLKPDEKLIDEIKYLFEQIFLYIKNFYYDFRDLIGYFIVVEVYLTLYYYLKKIEKIKL